MKKSIKLILFVLAMCLIFAGCNNTKTKPVTPVNQPSQGTQEQQEQLPPVVTEPINQDFSIEETYKSMAELLPENNLREMTSTEIDEAYGLGRYSGLEKFVATSQSDDSLTEIAMIKIGEDEQTEDILLIFAKRLEKLKQQHAENPAILEMLENSENVIIKQQASVSTMIIGTNAKELEERFDGAMQ